MVGMFINTLPVRVRVAPDEPLCPGCGACRSSRRSCASSSTPPSSGSTAGPTCPPGPPLFESIVVFENYPVGGALQEGSSLAVSASGAVEQTNYPLSLVAGPGERLALKLLYDPARYAPATAERLLGHLRHPAGGDGQRARTAAWATSPCCPPPSAGRSCVDWNATASLYPRDATVHQLVAAQAARDPQAVAVVDGGATLTYGELEAQANRLAQHLLALGVDPEDARGSLPGRSAAAVVALLAVLKAGAVYVPLDPAYPPARLAGMLEDAGAQVVLTAGGRRPDSPRGRRGPCAVRLVRLDDPREAAAIAARPATPPQVAGRPRGAGLRRLHLRLHRAPQGGGRHPPGDQPPGLQHGLHHPDARRPHRPRLEPLLRRRDLRAVGGPHPRGPPGRRRPRHRPLPPGPGGPHPAGADRGHVPHHRPLQPARGDHPGRLRQPCATSASGGKPPTPAPPRRCSARAPRKPCSTSTAPPSAPPSPPGTSWTSPRPRRTTSPSGAPSPTPRPTSWTPAGSRSPPASPASCTLAATGWPGATWGAPG